MKLVSLISLCFVLLVFGVPQPTYITYIVQLKFDNMTAVEWDEVKRLAADFQRAQLSSTVQR
jgi:hypothetical protein